MKKTSNVTISISRNAFNTNEVLHDIQLGIIRPNAISWAAENGYTEIAKSLINLGANINENSNYPLELSCKNGHTEIVRMLIEAGAKPSTSHDKDYCLRIAAFHGYTAIVKLLLDAGANPLANDYCALSLALNGGYMDIVELLINSICQIRASINANTPIER